MNTPDIPDQSQPAARGKFVPLWLSVFGEFLQYPFVGHAFRDQRTLPEKDAEATPEQVEQSKWIFEQGEARRTTLEEKARSTFNTITFLVPFLGSTFLVLFQQIAADSLVRSVAIVFFAISAVMLLIAFVSIVRAVAVQQMEMPFIQSVLDQELEFRKYDRAWHARGYLQCAMRNTGLNDMIAQLVKGAHILTAVAVGSFFLAAIFSGLAYIHYDAPPSEVKLAAPIEVKSADLAVVQASLDRLGSHMATLTQKVPSQGTIDAMRLQVRDLETRLMAIEKQLSEQARSKKTAK
ncbi:MAG: hypothetical protein R3D05_10855 [Dongiaceae bacterium]